MASPTLTGKIHPDAEVAVRHLRADVDKLSASHNDLKVRVSALPDPHGPLNDTQVQQVRKALLSGNQLIQQVQGFSVLPNIPTKDPKVKGALWSNSGVLTVSAG